LVEPRAYRLNVIVAVAKDSLLAGVAEIANLCQNNRWQVDIMTILPPEWYLSNFCAESLELDFEEVCHLADITAKRNIAAYTDMINSQVHTHKWTLVGDYLLIATASLSRCIKLSALLPVPIPTISRFASQHHATTATHYDYTHFCHRRL